MTRDAILAFAVALIVAVLATPMAARLAHRLGAIDEPRERGLHDEPTPSLGGLAILMAVLLAGIAFMPGGSATRGILAGAAVITLVGALDDVLHLNPFVKLAGQIVAAAIPVSAGVFVDSATLPLVGRMDFGDYGEPLTVLGIVALMNIVNFTDGVDGLAAGVCTISAATLSVIALSLDRPEAAILGALTAGAALGFLRHNFHPASVFMGDAGSNLLGFLLGAIAVVGVAKTAAVVALVFPLAVLAVPILDTTFVVAKRLKYRRPVYEADRWHFHHRLANIGFSQRRTVLYLYGWTLTLAGLALAVRFVPYSDDGGEHYNLGWLALLGAFALVALAASLYLVFVLEILKFSRFRAKELRRDAVEHGEVPDEEEIEEEIEREVETGEFEAQRI